MNGVMLMNDDEMYKQQIHCQTDELFSLCTGINLNFPQYDPVIKSFIYAMFRF